jgi:hypothetical protein
MQNLSEMTNTELKQYISEHHNNPDSFAAAMAVVMSRRSQPYPLDLANAQVEIEAILREKINDNQHSTNINSSIDSILLTHDEKKKLVFDYLTNIINENTNQQYTDRKKRRRRKHRTLSPVKVPTEFTLAIQNYVNDIDIAGVHTSKIFALAGGDKNILESCENDFQEICKAHTSRASSSFNVASLLLFIVVVFMLCMFGYFPIVDTKVNDGDTKTINELASLIAFMGTSTLITSTLMLWCKPFIEGEHWGSTSSYEYCIKLLKNAKLKANSIEIALPEKIQSLV